MLSCLDYPPASVDGPSLAPVSLGAREGTSLSSSQATTDRFAEMKVSVSYQRHLDGIKPAGGFAVPDVWSSLGPTATHHPALTPRRTSRGCRGAHPGAAGGQGEAAGGCHPAAAMTPGAETGKKGKVSLTWFAYSYFLLKDTVAWNS